MLKKTLFFFSDTFKRFVISFLINEASRICITFHPMICFWIVNLRASSYCAITMSITFRWIGCHIFHLLS